MRMVMRKPLGKMAGLTLLETMFALAVGALVLIGAIIFYMSTKQSANTSKAVGDMNAIVAAHESYIAGGYGLSGLGTTNSIPTLQKGGYLPDPINDPWGQEYTSIVATTPATVTITIPGIGGGATVGSGTEGQAGYVPPSDGDKNCNAIIQMVGSAAATGASGCSFVYPL